MASPSVPVEDSRSLDAGGSESSEPLPLEIYLVVLRLLMGLGLGMWITSSSSSMGSILMNGRGGDEKPVLESTIVCLAPDFDVVAAVAVEAAALVVDEVIAVEWFLRIAIAVLVATND